MHRWSQESLHWQQLRNQHICHRPGQYELIANDKKFQLCLFLAVQATVLQQQNEFNRIWKNILVELKKEKIFLKDETQLTQEQQLFVKKYFDEQVRSNVIPLMIESLAQMPYLRDKSIYLAVSMSKQDSAYKHKYSLIEVPAKANGRFILLPSKTGEKNIILLEDIIRFNLPEIYSYFGFEEFNAWVFKVTKDAEIDLDNDVTTTFVEKIEKGLKNRRKGKPVRFAYDKEMDASMLEYLITRLSLNKKSNLIPGGRIHNFRHFMDFPNVFKSTTNKRLPFHQPLLINNKRVAEIVQKQDVMLHFPYHSFNPIIDLLREAAMDETVVSIKITAYRLAENSKVINALINAARNGKQVVVMLELKARFDEEANLEWKEILEQEGIKVLLGVPRIKIHAKLCIIKKREKNRTIQYGFVSTGNLNESTAKVYADHCLLTSNRNIMADINKIFAYLENWKLGNNVLKTCKTLLVSPIDLRKKIIALIDKEIKLAKQKKQASIIIKGNSISDEILIAHLKRAIDAGVDVKLIIRGIFCPIFSTKKHHHQVQAISIVDEYLEHSRVMIFGVAKHQKIFISSADLMVRNLDHRVEAAVEITNENIKKELTDIINIQLNDNVKARVLDADLSNDYVKNNAIKKIRSQVETYHYLSKKQ